ncbi:hypothetical protein CFter6_2823 [Collimonas fungivorans]|uniref:Uncharacterized protein n=1 Tax=Collimonas fungivorans TaxID=158899 RepID=A0A127PDH3_9BURK|nr:hypothetical protein CFter6_2823 [Collimonas fungivorans]
MPLSRQAYHREGKNGVLRRGLATAPSIGAQLTIEKTSKLTRHSSCKKF